MMDIGKALKLLAECLGEIEPLKALSYKRGEGKLWMNKVEVILKAAFGKDSDEYKELESPYIRVISFDEEDRQNDYVSELNLYGEAIKKIIQKYELLGIEAEPEKVTEPPKAFIVHGGKSEARDKLYRFLNALGIMPLFIEEEPREGRSVNEQVQYYSEQADCVIVLGTADDKELKDGKLYPRRNVYIEIGRFQEKFSNRIIYLLEEGASFPSDISEKLYTRFTQQSMDEAFITVVRELKKFGLIIVQKYRRT